MRGEIERLLGRLAKELGVPLVLLNAEYRVVAFTPHSVDADPSRARVILRGGPREDVKRGLTDAGVREATRPVRTPAVSGVPVRILLPLRSDGMLVGFVSWLDQNDDEQIRRGECSPHAASLAALLRDRGTRTPVAHVLQRLLTGGAFAASDLPVLEAEGMRLGGRYRVLCVRWDGSIIIDPLSLLSGRPATRVDGLHAIVGEFDVDMQTLRAREGIAVGVGPEATLDSLALSWQAAVSASRIAAKGDTSYGSLVHWDDLGVERLFARMPLGSLTRADLPRSVRALLEDSRGPDLADTLLSYLDRGGDAAGVAASRGIGRSTVYHRLERAGAVAGVDLGDGAARLDLHAGLRIAQLAGLLE